MKRFNYILVLSLFLVSGVERVQAHEWDSARPDGHAPISVMGDHTHQQGEWMLSYRYMNMSMEGNLDGGDELSIDEVLSSYMMAPVKMTMEMHMLGVMYAPSDRWTLMLMAPMINNDMDMRLRMMNGMTRDFSTASSGIGDVKFSALIKVFSRTSQKLHLNVGVSLPSGSINERDDTPMGENVKLPYPMQLGSGTVDFLPGVTYLGQSADYSWGAQLSAVIRSGDNDEEYQLGNTWNAQTWLSTNLSESVSVSARLSYSKWLNIDGADSDLNPMMSPTANPDLRAGNRLDLGLGANYYVRKGPLEGHRIAFEYLLPATQDLDGPQLQLDSQLMLGWQLAL